MRAPAMMLGALVTVLGAYVVPAQLGGSAVEVVGGKTLALAGSWGGFSKNNVPIRLVVENVHSNWALVRFAWGKDADGSTPQASTWTRAKILPDGRLCISYPVHLILALSEDSRSLVGTTVHADPVTSVLLTRVE